jgi:hypothetical protein
MDDETQQEYFEIYMSLLTDNAYTSAIFSIDDFGRLKTMAELAWEASIAEDQGFLPVYAMWNDKNPYFIMFSPKTGLTGYFSNYLLEV